MYAEPGRNGLSVVWALFAALTLSAGSAAGQGVAVAVPAILSGTAPVSAQVEQLADLGPDALPLLFEVVDGATGAGPVTAAAALETIVRRHRAAPPCLDRPAGRKPYVTAAALQPFVLDADRPVAVRMLAVRLMGQLGDPAALPALADLVQDHAVGLAAIRALGAIGHPDAVSLLARLERDPDTEHRAAMTEALIVFRECAKGEGRALATTLLGRVATSDADARLRRHALRALAIPGVDGVDTVLVNALTDTDAYCRALAREALLARASALAGQSDKRPARLLLESAYQAASRFAEARPFAARLDALGDDVDLVARFPKVEVPVGVSGEDEFYLGRGWADPVRDATGALRRTIAHDAELRIPAVPGHPLTVDLALDARHPARVSLFWEGRRLPALFVDRVPLDETLQLTADEVGDATETTLVLRQTSLRVVDDQRPGNEPFQYGVDLRGLEISFLP